MDDSIGLWKLDIPTAAGFAYSVPESGAFTVKRPLGPDRPTPVGNASEAVSMALAAIAERGLLELTPEESLEVVGVTARYHGSIGGGDDATAERVGYTVLLGRSYAGIRVVGPPTMITLDSDGTIASFRKGWRDIAGDDGTVSLVSADTALARRDPLAVRYLRLKHSRCGYVEDRHSGAVQASPGVGCVHTYADDSARDPMTQEVEDWVNLAVDMDAQPLREKLALEKELAR